MSGPGPDSGAQEPDAQPPAASGGQPWTAPAAPASQPWAAPPVAAPVPGAAGFVYADVPNRIFAYIIDAIILAVIGLIVGIVLGAIFGPIYGLSVTATSVGVGTNYVAALVFLVVTLAISAAYWIYGWTRMRGTPGMKALGMQVGNYPDGKTLTQDQAIRRWVALGGPLPIVQVLNPIPGLGLLIGLLALIYFVYLVYSTAQSPTKQGFHDTFANSVVVKAARSA